MKIINLVKYGFVRSEADDFSDDGNRFICYRVGDMRVSKLVDRGDVYISAHYKPANWNKKAILDYSEYSALAHYKGLDRLNGHMVVSEITEDDLKQLYTDCVEYQKEYENAASEIILPTKEEIAKVSKQIRQARVAELQEIIDRISVDPVKILLASQDYNGKNLVNYMKSLKQLANPTGTDEEYADSILNTNYSRAFVSERSIAHDTQPSFYYRCCMESLDKIFAKK